jgi:hypothetical protein
MSGGVLMASQIKGKGVMEIVSLLFLVAYAVLILWGLLVALWPYAPSGRATQFPRMANTIGVSVDGIAESNLAIHLPTADRLCAVCEDKAACDDWLATRASAAEAPEFCANAAYLRLAQS